MLSKLGVAIAFVAFVALARADVTTQWERHYHVTNFNESFVDTAIDDEGFVYSIGTSSNGIDNDCLVVKNGSGGGLHWAIKFTGPGDQTPRGIAVSRDGQYVFIIYDQTSSQVNVKRLNSANGSVMWTHSEGTSSGRTVQGRFISVDSNNPPNVIAGFRSAKTGENAGIVEEIFNSTGTNTFSYAGFAATSDGDILDWTPRPVGGTYLLVGRPGIHPPTSSVRVMDTTAHVVTTVGVTDATALASNATKGVLFAAGRHSASSINVYRINTGTDALELTVTDTLPAVQDVEILDAAAGADGAGFALGYTKDAALGKQWYLARYRFAGLTKDWSVDPGANAANEFFRKGVIDQYGNLGAVGIREGANNEVSMQVYDSFGGGFLGQSGTTGTGTGTNLYGLAVNSSGIYASAGSKVVVGHTEGLVFKTIQDGLKRVALPLSSYVGGTTIAGSVTMYRSSTLGRQLSVTSSNDAFAHVVDQVSIGVGAISGSFTVTTQRTAYDRAIVLTGTYQGAIRTATFVLLAPRPSLLTFNPTSVKGGNPSTGTVTISSESPTGGMAVKLSSDGPQVTVPATVTIGAGLTTKTFTANTTVVAVQTIRTISATANGTTKTGTLTVTP